MTIITTDAGTRKSGESTPTKQNEIDPFWIKSSDGTMRYRFYITYNRARGEELGLSGVNMDAMQEIHKQIDVINNGLPVVKKKRIDQFKTIMSKKTENKIPDCFEIQCEMEVLR